MSNKPALRERIETALTVMRHRLETEHYDFHYDAKTEALDTILNFLKEELEGLTLTYEEIDAKLEDEWDGLDRISLAQFVQEYTIKELKEKMG